jgi:DNA modification methylase
LSLQVTDCVALSDNLCANIVYMSPEGAATSYVVGDARRDLMRLRERVSCVITSPPYYDVRNYGAKHQVGFGQTRDEFLSDMRLVLDFAYQLSTRDGFLWLVADSIRKDGEYVPLPHLFADCARQAGWKFQSSLVWEKDKTYPWLGQGRLRKIHEAILLFSKSAHPRLRIDRLRRAADISEWWLRYPERYNPLGIAPSDIWTEPIPTQGSWGRGYLRHECPFPPALVERMIELSTDPNDVVLDPFAGTGVVMATAAVMGRRGIGMDVIASYKERFGTEVLPAVQQWWHQRSAQREIERVHDDAFFRANVGLRSVKYARLLLRVARAHTAGAVGAWVRTAPWLAGEVVVFVGPDQDRDDLLTNLRVEAAKAPLSKFGLNMRLRVASHQSVRFQGRGYMYSNTATPVSAQRIDVRDFAKTLRASPVPLIGGTIDISADDVARVATRGWRDRDVDLGIPLAAQQLLPSAMP